MIDENIVYMYVRKKLLENKGITINEIYDELIKEYPKLKLEKEEEVRGMINRVIIGLKTREQKGKAKITSSTMNSSIIDLEKKKRLIELAGVLKTGVRTSIIHSFTKGGAYVDGDAIKRGYFDLIKNVKLEEDKELINDIFLHRKEILQKRISCEVELISSGEAIASLTLYSTLIEHGQPIVDFWEGRMIDPSSFPSLVKEFEGVMRGFECKDARINTSPTSKKKVTSVNTKFTFA